MADNMISAVDWLIAAYRRSLGMLFPTACRYYPTCSEYTRQAIVEHGVMTGCRLAARRLLRCHPLAGGGYDPVPKEIG